MSHEIRTPLNAIAGMCRLLLDSDLSQDQREFAETIDLNADILVALVNRTLELVKTESREAEVASAPFDVRALLADGLRLIGAQAAEKGLALGYTVDDRVPRRLVGDVERLRQILVNLLANAVKCTDRGGVGVSVAPREVDGERTDIQVTVRDTGIGIPPDRLEDVFAPFRQIGGPSRPQAQGTGLGLTICRSLVTLLGGRIWAESTPGEGSAFHFMFPAGSAPAGSVLPADVLRVEAEASDPGDAFRPGERRARSGDGGPDETMAARLPLRILVVEDNEVNQRVVYLMLQSLGYEADLAADGWEAVDAASIHTYDVVLMDVGLPGLDGYGATAEIQGRLGRSAPKVVALTASHSDEERIRCREAGMDAYLGKPVTIEQLAAVLTSLAGHHDGSQLK